MQANPDPDMKALAGLTARLAESAVRVSVVTASTADPNEVSKLTQGTAGRMFLLADPLGSGVSLSGGFQTRRPNKNRTRHRTMLTIERPRDPAET
jgi:hypothetical protein